MNPNTVLEFLRDHPQFLEDNAHLIYGTPAWSQDGRVLSLTERQLRTLREKNTNLEKQLRDMLRAGTDNDVIGERLHRVTLAFFAARDLTTTLDVLRQSLSEDFQVPCIAVRLWAAPDNMTRHIVECLPISFEIQEYTDALDTPYCGREVSGEVKSWFDGARALGSFALIPLRTRQTFGLLALGSPDEQRFPSGMGTVYLTRLSELASVALERYLSF
ncbi:MAG: DUF484 family protein [Burkholderiales bacterium]|jgi:uncharacterized protein YigA (DUF484 family)|nr:DUF484 family protein [Burkholderiales bacterium]